MHTTNNIKQSEVDLRHLGLAFFCDTHAVNPIGDYKVETVNANELISIDRIDLIAKLKYIEFKEKGYNSLFAKQLYVRHIEAFTLGTYSEMGNDHKTSIDAYIECFDALIDDIKTNGFNNAKSVIPVGANNIIFDGAHRVAICAYFNMEISIIRFPIAAPAINISFFKRRMLPENDLDYLMLEYCKNDNNIYLSCLWPAAKGVENRKAALNVLRESCSFAQVIYEKELTISYNGLRNFMPQVYASAPWLGKIENRFNTAMVKVNGCYDENGCLTVCLIRCDCLAKILDLKREVRDIFGIAEHSIHITDTADETMQMAKILLNENSLDFLNEGDPSRYIDYVKGLNDFKTSIIANMLNLDDFIIDSSGVMGIYGIRKPSDIDYLSLSSKNITSPNDNFDNHEAEAKYHTQSIDSLILDPSNFFVYDGIKFVSLKVLNDFKTKRNEPKDRDDIKLIEHYMKSKNNFRLLFIRCKNYIKRGLRNFIIKWITKLGLFEVTHRFYRSIKDKIFRI